MISELDRERQSLFSFVDTASYKGSPPLSSTIVIYITVQDAIDSPPYFWLLIQNVDVRENATVRSIIFMVDDLDRRTGDVTLLKLLDRETESFYQLKFEANDSVGLMSDNDGLTVELNVIDFNDRSSERVKVLATNKDAPKFLKIVYNVNVSENNPVRYYGHFKIPVSQLRYKLIRGQSFKM